MYDREHVGGTTNPDLGVVRACFLEEVTLTFKFRPEK